MMACEFRGFRSKSKYIMARWKDGLRPVQIVRESGLDHRFVSSVISYHLRRGPNMRAAASKRGISTTELKARIMEIVEKENMIDAILDDG